MRISRSICHVPLVMGVALSLGATLSKKDDAKPLASQQHDSNPSGTLRVEVPAVVLRALVGDAHVALPSVATSSVLDAAVDARCAAIQALTRNASVFHWEDVDAILKLADDAERARGWIKFLGPMEDGPHEDDWYLSEWQSVSACAMHQLLEMVQTASEEPLQLTDADRANQLGKPSFLAWWNTHKSKLVTP